VLLAQDVHAPCSMTGRASHTGHRVLMRIVEEFDDRAAEPLCRTYLRRCRRPRRMRRKPEHLGVQRLGSARVDDRVLMPGPQQLGRRFRHLAEAAQADQRDRAGCALPCLMTSALPISEQLRWAFGCCRCRSRADTDGDRRRCSGSSSRACRRIRLHPWRHVDDAGTPRDSRLSKRPWCVGPSSPLSPRDPCTAHVRFCSAIVDDHVVGPLMKVE